MAIIKYCIAITTLLFIGLVLVALNADCLEARCLSFLMDSTGAAQGSYVRTSSTLQQADPTPTPDVMAAPRPSPSEQPWGVVPIPIQPICDEASGLEAIDHEFSGFCARVKYELKSTLPYRKPPFVDPPSPTPTPLVSEASIQLYSEHGEEPQRQLLIEAKSQDMPIIINTNDGEVVFKSGDSESLKIDADGHIGIGVGDPTTKLHIDGGEWNVGNDVGDVTIGDNEYQLRFGVAVDGAGAGDARIFASGETSRLILGSGTEDIVSIEENSMSVYGQTTTHVLEITGGTDIAEPFQFSGDKSVKPGMVVSIDVDNPGQLTISEKPYDHTVAGIVSGAGNIDPGIILTKGAIKPNNYLVALNGQVYVWAETSNGAIEPGDLLTTSSIAGYAMKVTDYERANGAIIGKAMSELPYGAGLVLVLVSLQ